MNESETLGALWPLGARYEISGELWLGGCAASLLAREHGTPLYVFCEDTLRARARAYGAALRRFYAAGGRIAYASKAYLNLAIAQLMAEEGLDLDVVSGGELYVALQAGFPPGRIHFHGNNKSDAELSQALDAGVGRIVVDNFRELEALARLAGSRASAPVRVWLRLSTGILAQTHSHIQTGHDDTKFGFSITTGDAERAVVSAMHHPTLDLLGLHAHIGSQIADPEPLADNARRLAEFAALMGDRHGFTLRELSPGGGWGVPMTEADKPAPIESYVRAVSQALTQACRSAGLDLPYLVLEPGRSIVAPAGVAIYQVGARKEIPGVRTYVSVDGGMTDNIRPALYGARYTALAIRGSPEVWSGLIEEKPPSVENVTIAGKFCESGDVLIRDIELPRLAPGDRLAVPMAGAYTVAMASNYNLATRPAVVMVKDGRARLIQRRESYSELVARDLPLHQTGTEGAREEADSSTEQSRCPAPLPFWKYQASGNDYIVLDPVDWPEPPSPDQVRRICDRNRGIGADGVLWGPIAPVEPFSLRLFNPDGSEFEKSGNGLRIFARYLWDRGQTSGAQFVLKTPAGPVTAHVLDAAGSMIGLEMGRISFDSVQIPVAGPRREVIREPLTLGDRQIRFTAVTIGNPHCVVFADDLIPEGMEVYESSSTWLTRLAQELGPAIECLPLFPNRTNVQFVRVVDRHTLVLAIWERGAGYTLASGTSSCAAAAAAIRLGLCDSPVTVEMPGGSAVIEITADGLTRLTGPVAQVFTGELSQGCSTAMREE
jgi:diaminopimelate decarboxylase